VDESKSKMSDRLEGEINEWQQKLDEARVQADLAGKDALAALKPHIDRLELELARAQEQWRSLQSASEGAMGELQRGITTSMSAMREAFEQASKHFVRKDDD
jgi:predicted  nucleic acid-binding Zn-ribbon protein